MRKGHRRNRYLLTERHYGGRSPSPCRRGPAIDYHYALRKRGHVVIIGIIVVIGVRVIFGWSLETQQLRGPAVE